MAQRYYSATDAGERASTCRALAEQVVEARQHFERADGSTDWQGRTFRYRQWLGDVYGGTGLSPKQVSNLQAAVRYHVGGVLRETLDAETLAAYGFQDASPREASTYRSAARSALLRTLTGRLGEDGTVLSLAAALSALHLCYACGRSGARR